MSRYFEKMTRLAMRRGVMAEEKADGLHITMYGAPFCRVDEKGGVFYRDADVSTRAQRQAKNDIVKSANIVWEYVAAMPRVIFVLPRLVMLAAAVVSGAGQDGNASILQHLFCNPKGFCRRCPW